MRNVFEILHDKTLLGVALEVGFNYLALPQIRGILIKNIIPYLLNGQEKGDLKYTARIIS